MTPRVQNGLRNIHLVRVKIEEIMSNQLSSDDSSDLMALVRSVRSNIQHIYKLLDLVVDKGVSSAEMAIISKLRNDILKEEVCYALTILLNKYVALNFPFFVQYAIDRAVGDRKDPAGLQPLQKKKSFMTESQLAGSPTNASREGGFIPLGQTDKRPSFAGRGVSGGSGGGGMDQAAAVAASGGGVKKGTAGSFDPSLLGGGGSGGSREQGFFVARDQDLKQVAAIEKVVKPQYFNGLFFRFIFISLLQKLQAVSEVETQSALIEERTEAIESVRKSLSFFVLKYDLILMSWQMHKDIVRVKELFQDLAVLIEEQQVNILSCIVKESK